MLAYRGEGPVAENTREGKPRRKKLKVTMNIKESVWGKLEKSAENRGLTTETLVRQILEVWMLDHPLKED